MIGAKDRKNLEALLACPYDRSEIQRVGSAYRCRNCERQFPLIGRVPNFLAFEKTYEELTYAIPWHPIPSESRLTRIICWLRTLPTYYRLVITSNHFALLLERLIFRKSRSCKAVLDIGCREGHTLMLARRAGITVGIDIDIKAVIYADAYAPMNCHAMLASGMRLPFKDEAFDLVTCTEVIEHVEEYSELIAEAARVTRKGGEVVFSTPHGDIHPIPSNPLHLRHFKEQELKELFVRWFSATRIQSVVTNCGIRSIYWRFDKRWAGKCPKPIMLAVNTISNLSYYIGGYHRSSAYKRSDVRDAQFVVTASK